MAAGCLTALAGGAIQVCSTGSLPTDQVNPAAVAAMAEFGISIVAEVPEVLTTDSVRASDVVITMGVGGCLAGLPGNRCEDQNLEDSAGQGVEAVRLIRDESAPASGLIADLLLTTV